MKNYRSLFAIIAVAFMVAASAPIVMAQKYLIPGKDPVDRNFQPGPGQHIVLSDIPICSDGWGSGHGKRVKGCYAPGTAAVVDDVTGFVVGILYCGNPPQEKNVFIKGKVIPVTITAPVATIPSPAQATPPAVKPPQEDYTSTSCSMNLNHLAELDAQRGDKGYHKTTYHCGDEGEDYSSTNAKKYPKPPGSGGGGFWGGVKEALDYATVPTGYAGDVISVGMMPMYWAPGYGYRRDRDGGYNHVYHSGPGRPHPGPVQPQPPGTINTGGANNRGGNVNTGGANNRGGSGAGVGHAGGGPMVMHAGPHR